jgi:hypothetical protein
LVGLLDRVPRVLSGELPLRDEHTVHEELDRAAGQAPRAGGVRAREGAHVEPVVRGLRMEDLAWPLFAPDAVRWRPWIVWAGSEREPK